MTLQEALTIGSKAEGSIKATYVILYNEKGERLFSLQNTNAQYNISDLIEENGKVLAGDIAIIHTADPKTLLFRDVKLTAKKGIGDVEDVNELDMTPYRLPVVKASVYNLNRSRMNPVTLTPEAREIILEKIMPKTQYYRLEVEYDVFKNGILSKTPDEHRTEVLYEGYVPFVQTNWYDGAGHKSVKGWNNLYKKYKKQDHFMRSIAYVLGRYLYVKRKYNANTSNGLWYSTEWVKLMENGGIEAYLKMIQDEKAYKWLIKYQKKYPEIYVNVTLKPYVETKVAAPYAKLAEIIKDNGTLYAKPVAFDWSAIDLKNATVESEDGTEINLDDAIQAAQEELQQAKNMLYLAGASSLF